jgi:hypothetical protein
LYWFIKFYNANDSDILINILTLTSPITIVGYFFGICCKLVCKKLIK